MEIQGIHLTGPHLEKGPTERHLSWGVYSGLIGKISQTRLQIFDCSDVMSEYLRWKV